MAADVAIFIEKRTPRLLYTLRFVFEDVFNMSWRYFCDQDEFLSEEPVLKINYSRHDLEDCFRIAPHGLLSETDLFEQNIKMSQWNDLPVFFGSPNKADIPFDPLAATFYCISRFEEYLPFVADEHGRFPAEQSLAFSQDFLKRPLVNEWWTAIFEIWKEAHPNLAGAKPSFKFISTVDVDNSYAFRGKGPARVLSALARDVYQMDNYTLSKRWDTLFKRKQDPFDTYDREMQLASEKKFDLIYFVLFSEFGPHDRNISRFSQKLQKSVRHIADFAKIAIHPSYRCMDEEDRLIKEHSGLQEVVRRKITKSRQHYLRMQLPKTYRQLKSLGIEQEYSMGYSRVTGWRASTCTPFRFYDLEMEEETELKVFPFPFMDSVYIDQLKLSKPEAWTEICTFIDQAKVHKGVFISVMHNRYLGNLLPESEGWVEMYHNMIDYIQ